MNFGRLVAAENAHIENLLTKKCQVREVQDAPLRSYKRLKNEISRVSNRNICKFLKFSLLPPVEISLFNHPL